MPIASQTMIDLLHAYRRRFAVGIRAQRYRTDYAIDARMS